MSSYGHVAAQRARILAQAQAATQQRKRVAQAYLAWGQSEVGAVMLDDLVQSVLLRPSMTPEDEGERRLVLKMLKMIAEAPDVLREGVDTNG